MTIILGENTVKNTNSTEGLSLNSTLKKKLIELNVDNDDVSETYIQVGKEIYFGSSNNELVFKKNDEDLLSINADEVLMKRVEVEDGMFSNLNSEVCFTSNLKVYNGVNLCSNMIISEESVDIFKSVHVNEGIICRGGLNVDKIEGSNISIAGLVLDNFVTREGIFDNRVSINTNEKDSIPFTIEKTNSCNFMELNDVFTIDKSGGLDIQGLIYINAEDYPFKYNDNYEINKTGHLTIGKSKVLIEEIDSYDKYKRRDNNSILHLHRRDDKKQHEIVKDPILNITMDYMACNNILTCNYEREPFSVQPFLKETVGDILIEDIDGSIISACNYQLIVELLPFVEENAVWKKDGELVEFSPFLGDPDLSIYRPKLYFQKYDYLDYNIEAINPLLNPEYIEKNSNVTLIFGYWHTNQDSLITNMNKLKTDDNLLQIFRDGIDEYTFLEYSYTCNMFHELNIDIKILIENSDDIKYIEYVCNLENIVEAPSLMKVTCNNEHMFEIDKDGKLIAHEMNIDKILELNSLSLYDGINTNFDMYGCNIDNVGKIEVNEVYLSKIRVGDIVEITKDEGIVILDSSAEIENRITTANISRINSPFLKYGDESTIILNKFYVASNIEEVEGLEGDINSSSSSVLIGNTYFRGDLKIDGRINLDNVITYVDNNRYLVEDESNIFISGNRNGTISFGNNGHVTLSTSKLDQIMTVGVPINRIQIDFPEIEDISGWYNRHNDIVMNPDVFLMNLHDISQDEYNDYMKDTCFMVYGNARFSDRRNLTLLNVREYDNNFKDEPTINIYGNITCREKRIGVNTDGTFKTDSNSHAFRCEGDAIITGKLQAIQGVSSLSDQRMKENLVPIEGAIDKIKKLNGYIFTRKDTKNIESGLLAQEVQKVLPEVVNEDKNGTLSIAYGNMMGLIVEAIKELSNK